MNLNVEPITKVLFFAYFGILILVSAFAYKQRKRAKNFQEEYYVAGRSFGPWIVAFTWATSWTSGGTFIGTPSVYYSFGWTTILWQAGAAILGICGMLMIGRRIAKFASDNNCVTLPDLFTARFHNRWMGILAAGSIIIFGVAYMVSQYTAAARILETFFDFDFVTAVVLFAVVTAVYTVVGGIRGVAYNALLQGIIMLGGSVVVAAIVINKAGGLSAVTAAQQSIDPALLTPPGPQNYLPLATAFSTFFTLGVAVMAQPHVVTRIFTVRDTKSLKRAGALISIICMIWFFSLFLAAQAGRALIPNIGVSDQIFPTLVLSYCGKYLAGIIMCAPFAAVMSTVSGLILTVSSAVIKDIYQRNAKTQLEGDKLKKATYAATLFFSLLVMGLSLKPPAFLQDIVMFAVNGYAASFTMPLLLGFFWKKTTSAAAISGMIAGFATLILLYILPIPTNLLGFNPLIWGMLVSAVTMVVVSKHTKITNPELVEAIFR